MIKMFQFHAVLSHWHAKTEKDTLVQQRQDQGLLRKFSNLCIFFCLLFMVSPASRAATPGNTNFVDYKIRAVYVHHFANFVHWPEKRSAIRFCTLGKDSVTVTLQHLIKERPLPGYQSSFRSLSNLSDASNNCDILYLTKRKMRMLQRIPQYAKVLTVSSSPDFLNQGGMIELRSVDNQVKPAIELANVEKGQLTISSQLLRIALHPSVQAGGNND